MFFICIELKIMTAYKKFITAVGKLLGGDDKMAKRAEEIVAFETKLAKVRTSILKVDAYKMLFSL